MLGRIIEIVFGLIRTFGVPVIIFFTICFLSAIISAEIDDRKRIKEEEKHLRRLSNIPVEERKCSNCRWVGSIRNYKEGNREIIVTECTYGTYREVNGITIMGGGEGEFVREENHIDCPNFEHQLEAWFD